MAQREAFDFDNDTTLSAGGTEALAVSTGVPIYSATTYFVYTNEAGVDSVATTPEASVLTGSVGSMDGYNRLICWFKHNKSGPEAYPFRLTLGRKTTEAAAEFITPELIPGPNARWERYVVDNPLPANFGNTAAQATDVDDVLSVHVWFNPTTTNTITYEFLMMLCPGSVASQVIPPRASIADRGII